MTLAFHDVTGLQRDLEELAMNFHDVATLHRVGTTGEGRSINALRVSRLPAAANIPRLILVGCHHAREWISVETPFLIAKRILDAESDTDIRPLLEAAELWFVPMLNPDGHAFSTQRATEIGSEPPRQWRKNRRRNGDGTFGVDLNRNYAFGWGGEGSIDIPGSRMYRGPAPFSEPETRAVGAMVLGGPTIGLISYHSYGLEFAHPFGFLGAPCEAQCQAKLQLIEGLAGDMAQIANTVGGQGYHAIAAHQHYEEQEIRGDCADWVFATTGAPALTVELRPDIYSQVGFELAPDQIEPTFEENWEPALHFMRFALDRPSGATARSACSHERTSNGGE